MVAGRVMIASSRFGLRQPRKRKGDLAAVGRALLMTRANIQRKKWKKEREHGPVSRRVRKTL